MVSAFSPGGRQVRTGRGWSFLFFWWLVVLSPSWGHAAGDGRWAILLAGISGDPDLQKEFLSELKNLRAILETTALIPKERIAVLADDPSKDPDLVRLQCTRQNLQAVCREFAAKVRQEDLVFIFLVGHGNFEGNVYKLNLVGPDPTAEEIASMLYSIPAKQIVVINTTTCSGGSLPAFSHPGTIVVTATKSGMEKNQTRMAAFLIEAFKDHNADVDKNGRVSILEAFSFAARKVEESYDKEGALQTEHPVLDDNGDGQGHAQPGPDNGDGFLARTTYLEAAPPLMTQVKLDPEQQALAAEAEAIEKQIEALKYAKAEMSETEYEKKLEALLLRLAQINEKLPKK